MYMKETREDGSAGRDGDGRATKPRGRELAVG